MPNASMHPEENFLRRQAHGIIGVRDKQIKKNRLRKENFDSPSYRVQKLSIGVHPT
jgi:hypothetical protein